MVRYRKLSEKEINRKLFRNFIRRQAVTKCWRRENGKWVVKDDPFIDDWTDEEYNQILLDLQETVRSGGFVYAAFYCGQLKGFVSVASTVFGVSQRYLDLTNLYVSEDLRRQGIGKALFDAAKAWAKEHAAESLYISAHSSVESQMFYKKMGCAEAKEYNRAHVEKEPFDCQMECKL